MQKKKKCYRGHSTTTWTRRGRGGQHEANECPPKGRGVGLECPRGPKFEKKSSYFIKYFIPLSSVMGDKIKIRLIKLVYILLSLEAKLPM